MLVAMIYIGIVSLFLYFLFFFLIYQFEILCILCAERGLTKIEYI